MLVYNFDLSNILISKIDIKYDNVIIKAWIISTNNTNDIVCYFAENEMHHQI